MSTLYAISDNLLALDALLDETDGEVTPEIEAWMAEYGDELAGKVDGLVSYLRDRQARGEAMKAEAAVLTAKARTEARKVDSLKGYVQGQMGRLGVREMAGTIWSVALQKNGGKPVLTLLADPALFPDDLVTVVTTRTVNKDAVRARLAVGGVQTLAVWVDGQEPTQVPLARLEPVGESLRIR